MPRSVAEIEADIAKVKAEMALRDKYERGFNQPQTKVGWGSYIVSGDRGMLDQYQNRENQWKNMQEQQAYQSAERALQQKFQDEQAIKNRQFQAEQAVENRQLQRDIALMNKEISKDDKKEAARLQLQKLEVARDGIAKSGGDTRQIDAEIEYLRNKYDFPKVAAEPYDPRNSVNYKLSKFSQITDKNTLDEIDDAIYNLSEYDTPEAAKRLAELDDIREKRVKYEESDKYRKEQINNWKGDGLSSWLTNHDYQERIADEFVELRDKSGKLIRKVKKSKTTPTSGKEWPD